MIPLKPFSDIVKYLKESDKDTVLNTFKEELAKESRKQPEATKNMLRRTYDKAP